MADHRADPSALRFLIGHDLKATRERVNRKQTEAANVLGCSQAKINYLESGKTQQKPDEVTALLRSYGADVEHVDRMASLAGRADQGTWWAPFSDVLPNWFKTFVGLEGLAATEFSYESMLLPGQLQTPDYAAALLVGNLRVPPMDAPHVVRARMARQRLTDEANPLRLRTVIEQYVLERVVGGPRVMRGQLEHLLVLMERGNVELHVMPVDVTVHDGLDGDFLLLDFDEAQSIGYIEYPTGAIYIQDQDQVGAYVLSADRLCATALSESDSAAAIAARIEALATNSED
ncbi:helix-turn-helix domain-containing protein [Actinokineospora inagensis]|uniref:helix-turn-helix domain-containing protein n=1 Tax=Actinokineospora inagensis TaxID=103730 RepID=UPI0003F60C13|nr:helix-turn-helix transcriptional regulator [Actinokineospora inagensis]